MSRFVAALLATLALASLSSPASSNDPNEYIREQHAAECQRQGGTYDYPKCYLPDRSQQAPQSIEPTCDWACQLIVGALGLAAARVAFCKANPERC